MLMTGDKSSDSPIHAEIFFRYRCRPRSSRSTKARASPRSSRKSDARARYDPRPKPPGRTWKTPKFGGDQVRAAPIKITLPSCASRRMVSAVCSPPSGRRDANRTIHPSHLDFRRAIFREKLGEAHPAVVIPSTCSIRFRSNTVQVRPRVGPPQQLREAVPPPFAPINPPAARSSRPATRGRRA